MEFGGNTRDMGSFREETDKIMDLHQDSPRSIVLRAWDGIAGIMRHRHDLSGDGVWILAKASQLMYVDGFDIDEFSVHKLNDVMEELGYVNDDPIYYHYMIPGTDLDIGLRALGNDMDVKGLARRKTIVTEFDSMNATEPETMPAFFNTSEPETLSANVNASEPENVAAFVNTSELETLSANVNASEPKTVAFIVVELFSMNYEFDPLEDNVTVSMNEQPSVNEQLSFNEQPTFNGSEIDTDENLEPIETLVEDEQEYETMDEDGDDSGSDEDDSDYIVDEDDNLEKVNIDMNDYHFNIDANVEWVRHTSRGQKIDHAPIPTKFDVLDNDYFESGSSQKIAALAEIKERVKLHSIETKRKLLLVKDDKLRIREKCLGKIHVFTLDGEGPSNTKVVAPKKVAKKGKNVVGPSDLVGPTKKVVSSGGRGRLKPLADDECPWALKILKVNKTKTWEVRTYTNEHKCLQSREIHACTSKFFVKGIIKQVEKNPDIPIRTLQYELQKKYELVVSRMKAFRAKSVAINQVKGDYRQQYLILRDYCLELRRANPNTTIKIEAGGRDLLGLDGAFMKGPYPGQLLTDVGLECNNGIYPLAYAIVEKETISSWTWFLECLGDDLGMFRESNSTFISDRKKFCLRHIYENMKQKWNGQAYKDPRWRCATTTTISYFDKEIEELKSFNSDAFEWLLSMGGDYEVKGPKGDQCVVNVSNKATTTYHVRAKGTNECNLYVRGKEPMNVTGTGTSQRSSTVATRKRPSNAANDRNGPVKKKKAATSSSAGGTVTS
ncbi:hypothetical protein Tco_0580582 [Tanacetum coccineum]